MGNQSIIWEESLKHYRIFGSVSPATLKQKLEQIPNSGQPELLASAAVFVDILRATTTLVAVGASGCRGIVIEKKPTDNKYLFEAPFLESEPWVFGGEYNGGPITGQDSSGNEINGVIDNSPRTVTHTNFRGKYLRFFSTNGAAAFDVLTSAQFGAIYALSLANIEATAIDLLKRNPERIWLVGGGFYGSGTTEDSVVAGLLIKRLLELGYATCSQVDDEADTMMTQGRYFMQGRKFLDQELLTRLKTGVVYNILNNRGHKLDIEACINGHGMEEVWSQMESITLVCTDMKQRLLIPHLQTTSNGIIFNPS